MKRRTLQNKIKIEKERLITLFNKEVSVNKFSEAETDSFILPNEDAEFDFNMYPTQTLKQKLQNWYSMYGPSVACFKAFWKFWKTKA